MRKKVFFVVLVFCLVFSIINFIFEILFAQKDVEMSFKEAYQVCTSGVYKCESQINLKDSDLSKLDKIKTLATLKKYPAVKNFLSYTLLIFSFIFAIYLFFYNGFYFKERKKPSLKEILLFSYMPLYFICFFYSINIFEVPFSFFVQAVFFGLVFFYVLYFIFAKITKNYSCALLFAAFLTAGIIYSTSLFNLEYYPVSLFIMLFISFFATVDSNIWIKFLKPFIAVLLIFTLYNTGLNIAKRIHYIYTISSHKFELSNENTKINTTRDVYIILMDMYGGVDSLKSIDFDNSEFIKKLESYGFKTFPNISSNYSKTIISLSSFLNFDYITSLSYVSSEQATNNAKFFSLFKNSGYTIYYLNPINTNFDIKKNEIIDEVISNDFAAKFSSLEAFLGATIFSHFYFFKNYQTKIDDDIYIHLDNILENKNKKLLFAHFLMPHPPYLKDKNKMPIEGKETDNKCTLKQCSLNEKSYISYLEYSNQASIELIEKILLTSEKKPIIIFLGDHGYRKHFYLDNDEYYFQKEKINKDYTKSFFNTFLAYYNPDSDYKFYNDTPTLLSFFRKFAKEIFNLDYPLDSANKKFYLYWDIPYYMYSDIKGEFVDF